MFRLSCTDIIRMKYTFILSSLLFLANINIANSASNNVNDRLNETLSNKLEYNLRKEERINQLKSLQINLSPLSQYELNDNLVNEYRKFKLDSAISYIKQNIAIAQKLNREDLNNSAQLQLATLYTLRGLYREAEHILTSINKSKLTNDLLANYYEAYSQLFGNYISNNETEKYSLQCEIYRDSLLDLLDPSSIRYRLNSAEKSINLKLSSNTESDLLKLIAVENSDTPNYAMTTYLLGQLYRQQRKSELAKYYYTLSAITDMRIANKDNASLQNLAILFYESGDIDNAFKCSNSALEDAIFCNVQFRTLRMSEFYNIINTSYQEKENKNKSTLHLFLLLVSILSISLAIAIIFVYKQMVRLSRTREELFQTTQQLAMLNSEITSTNEQLQQKNHELSESNHIKEEYIAHFFDLCSTYINKLDNYRSMLNKKALANQHEELFKILRSTTLVETELEELYKIFDTIFINLYPTFVKEFNALLIPEEQVVLKPNEILNTELRIFALIRLGITDSIKIAAFLRYSLSSIYNYRTRARNKAAVTRNEFEEMVGKIGSFQKNVK